jgi:hypothetical protein
MIKIPKNHKFDKKELTIGTKIELEHTNSKSKAKLIAKQHLVEFPKYYSKGLIPMEKKLEKLKK